MEKLTPEQLRHILPEERERIQAMYERGDFGAHTLAVRRFLSEEKVPVKQMFRHTEQYLPDRSELPNTGLVAVFHLMACLIHLTTPQRTLVLDAEEYCKGSPESFGGDIHDIRQRFVWERSNELVEPFWE